MFVFSQVSSRNTSLRRSSFRRSQFHRMRLQAISARARSLASKVFFSRDPDPPRCAPHRPDADRDPVRQLQPGAPLLQRRARMLAHMRCNGRVVIGQLRSTPAALPPRWQPSLAITPLASLDDIGDADIVAFGTCRALPSSARTRSRKSGDGFAHDATPSPPPVMPETHESHRAPVP